MKSICLTFAATLVLLLSPAAKAAPPCCGFWLVDWDSWCMSAHVPFALEHMTPYYIPRTPPCYVTPRYWVDHCERGPCSYMPQVADGFEPAGFQRLGQIPNDQLLENLGTDR